MADAGTAFWDAYATVSNAQENKRRGLIAERADKRAQGEYDVKEADRIAADQHANELATIIEENGKRALARARGGNPAPIQAGTPPPGTPPPQGMPPAEPAPPAPRTAAMLSPDQATASPAPPSPPGGNLPVPPPVGAGGPPSRAAMPEAAPPPSPQSAGYDLNAAIEDGQDLANKVIPLTIRYLNKTHQPVEAAKLATALADPVMLERTAKIGTILSLMQVDSAHPALPKLIGSVFPGMDPASYVPHPPDPSGQNGYAQFTIHNPDGSTREMSVTPAQLRAMAVSTFSPTKMVDETRHVEEQKRKEKADEAQAKHWKASEDEAGKRYDLAVEEFKAGDPERKARAARDFAAAANYGKSSAAMDEDRTAKREQKGGNDFDAAVWKAMGTTPAAAATDETLNAKTRGVYSAAYQTAQNNDMKLSGPLGFALTSAMMHAAENKGAGVFQKDGEYLLDVGGGLSKAVRIPPTALSALGIKPGTTKVQPPRAAITGP